MRAVDRKICYRVRPLVVAEEVVPIESKSTCFSSRQDAEIFAHSMVKGQKTPMVIEKLAPAGCWLQVLSVGI
jgi:hypothetical protein